jgi:hypothetical protein
MGTEMTTTNHVPLEALMLDPTFLVLTPRQRLFIAALLCLDYNASAAAKIAYKSDNAAILGAALLKQGKVKRVLDIHFGRSKMDSLLEDLHRVIKHSLRRGSKRGVTPELAAALAFYEKHAGHPWNVDKGDDYGDGKAMHS